MTKKILTASQRKVIKKISQAKDINDQFVLTGGTALAGFYLHHRFSEDLDLFSQEEVDPEMIHVFLTSLRKELAITDIDFQHTFNRHIYFLTLKNSEILKMEFTYFPFSPIENPLQQEGIRVESIIDLAVNKLFTIYQRLTARDFIDLFFILQTYPFSLSDITKKAKIKFDWHIDPLQLGTQFIQAQKLKDYPRMVQPFNHNHWKKFFLKEAEKLEKDVFDYDHS
ncbi:MAG: hypothetical protein A3H59_03405 [Candidatus Jacksonbacteria bacterium RIFCSPLOWO2_02_FULL_43_9]|nr:MAG: hypothetical protein UV70_C0001G0048 [Parcubacteria group bacterium GW2011_GWA2_43_13]OGY71602.1 MAG: hypothetical protein A2986_01680 [Candidatus Jacksonbacteria bacterium RIFCSPLOWO2_01_FULL_44_13]OGY73704.1 MAG: hypothetical protein A3H59_03405 [Candidatus Jacksonbacteria bacterium RIFCSPLOWO2_02_FULL_43_9]HAZ16597.1 hypothetical protein [Candidatus Jacksonbacteria bacterium]